MTEDRTPHRNRITTRWRRAGVAVTVVGALVASTVVALPVSPAGANDSLPPTPLPLDIEGPVLISGSPSAPDPGFTDVPATSYFAQGAAWLKDEGITVGQGGPGKYSPDQVVTRRQMALFLHRLVSTPIPLQLCSFDDITVDPNNVDDVRFAGAVCWLKENGITQGTNPPAGTLFSPAAPVTRGQMALFMHRLSGLRTGSASSGFTDVPDSPGLRAAVDWMKANAITTGLSPTSYGPNGLVTRGQMAAFLLRLASTGDAWNPGVVARGSVEQISAEGATGTTVSVYNSDEVLVDTATLDIDGGKIWRKVAPGTYYVVTGADENFTTTEVVVSDLEDAEPEGPLYSGQTLRSGFNYITMRDGTRLSAMVTFPGGPGPYPTLVEYSGYDLSNPYDPTSGSSPYRLLAPQFGYALVQVQMRGTGCSGGAFDYFEPVQSLDGYDAIETIASQSWVKPNTITGEKVVGTVGISYPGISQLFVAQAQPPSLAAITPVSVISDTVRAVLFPGGIYNNGFAQGWAEGAVSRGQPARRQSDGTWRGGVDYVGTKITGIDRQGVRVGDRDPVCRASQRLHGQAADLLGLIDENDYETPEFHYLSPMRFVDKIVTPTLMVGAWQDEQTGGMWPNMLGQFPEDTFVRMIAQNGTHIEPIAPDNLKAAFEHLAFFVKGERPNVNVALLNTLIGLAAGQLLGGSIPAGGEISFTASEYDNTTKYPTFQSAFDAWVNGPRAIIRFDNGAGPTGNAGGSLIPSETRQFSKWPLSEQEATTQEWFLRGDGTLGSAAPTVNAGLPGSVVTYDYDPTVGLVKTYRSGNGCSEWLPEPKDNNGNSCLDWVDPDDNKEAAFISAPLSESAVMVGNGLADLWVTWDPVDSENPAEPFTDIEVTISEVRADGKEIYVQSGWTRTSFCANDPELSTLLAPWFTGTIEDATNFCQMVPGVPRKVEVPIFPFGHIFRAGSQVRVTVDAPGGSRVAWTFDSAMDAGTHTLGTSVQYPSRIILPIVTNQVRDTYTTGAANPNPAARWVTQPVTAPALGTSPRCGILRAQPCRTYSPPGGNGGNG
jgi:predicted acyl esterase